MAVRNCSEKKEMEARKIDGDRKVHLGKRESKIIKSSESATIWKREKNLKQYDYEVVRKVGRGKYSEVFEGVNVNSKEKCMHHQDPQTC
ncbi:hypothetical protein YC2023_020753 [Brassica napus]